MTLLIPQTLHQIWLGSSPFPDEFARYRETWRDHHPAWRLELWTEDHLPAELRRDEVLDRLRVPAERADILRLEVLWRYGGIYVDTDFECRGSIEPLLDGVDFFTAYLKPGRVNNAIIGATAGHPILDRALSELRPNEVYGYDKRAAGPLFFDAIVKEHPEIRIFDPELFYPATPEQRSQALAIHHAARSWKDTTGFQAAAQKAERRRQQAVRELSALGEEANRIADQIRTESFVLERVRAGASLEKATLGRRGMHKRALLRRLAAVIRARAVRRTRTLRARFRRLLPAGGKTASGWFRLRAGRRRVASDLRIPRVVHHVWLGPEPLPAEAEGARRSWRLNRGWEQRVWTEANLPDDLARPETRELLRPPQERSRLLRLELLHRFGGVAVDSDLACRLPIEPLLDGAELVIASTAEGRPDESLLAATPSHPVVELVLREFPAVSEWGADTARIGDLLERRVPAGDPHVVVLAPSLVAARGAETAETAAVRLHDSGEATGDARVEALEAEATLSEAQAEVELARRCVREAEAQLAAIRLELNGALSEHGRRGSRAAGPAG